MRKKSSAVRLLILDAETSVRGGLNVFPGEYGFETAAGESTTEACDRMRGKTLRV